MLKSWFGSRRRSKVELHLHMDGAIRIDTFLDVARRRGIELPSRTPEGLARYVRVDPELALRGTIERFSERFRHVESSLDKPMGEATLEEMDVLWEEAKRLAAERSSAAPSEEA